MNEELKPCPFCGVIPSCGVEFYESHASEIKLQAVVKCNFCHISMGRVFKASDAISLIPFYDFEKVFDAVQKDWNRRAYEERREDA